ncbi:ATP-binding protein [Streptomyces sp. NPDC060194]|uniref:ATP-binding protein n=1 Tax=Streptomyces sp. NPDC060194 TaxID=3347069 RepID=UPI0036610AC3
MQSDGTRGARDASEARDTGGARARRPRPVPPPRPAHAPDAEPPFLAWLRVPRPEAAPGIWRQGYVPRPPDEPDRIPGRQLVAGALIAFLCGWLLWSLLYNGYLGSWWFWPVLALVPDHWYQGAADDRAAFEFVSNAYYVLVGGGILVAFARLGRWGEVWKRYGPARLARSRTAAQDVPHEDPSLWPRLRAGGAEQAAERLLAEARAGRMGDVDHARIERAWQSVRSGRNSLAAFTDTVLREGAAACVHPSGARDLTGRSAVHDLAAGQVRLGTAADDPRNPSAYRAAGLGLSPGLLATSLLAVGPAGSGKTGRLVRPVTEALCLQALAGRAAVVAVGTGAGLGRPEDFDVVVRIGHPDSAHDLDLYGGAADPDEAAALLAEALVGDLDATGGSRRAAVALAQLLGPYRAAHGRFPGIPELRDLLEGAAGPLAALRTALTEAGEHAALRELDARERQAGAAGDPGAQLADRIALLDRPAFADFLGGGPGGRAFSLRALEHPVRVRIELPERGHADAARILARLVLAQFTAAATARTDRSLFAAMVLDDASYAVTGEAIRGLKGLRSANAGVVLTLRTLDDVPRPLRTALLGAVGCRMVLSGVTPWDGQDFAEVWGKEWVEARDVTDRQIITDEPLTKVTHFVRRLVTGKGPTAQSVTVRQVERERWSASELAHAVPPGHGVVSLTDVRGEHAPPVLVDLRA